MINNYATVQMIQNVINGTTPPQQSTKAMQDGSGNNIENTYLKNAGGTVNGSLNITGTISEKGQRVYSPNNPPPLYKHLLIITFTATSSTNVSGRVMMLIEDSIETEITDVETLSEHIGVFQAWPASGKTVTSSGEQHTAYGVIAAGGGTSDEYVAVLGVKDDGTVSQDNFTISRSNVTFTDTVK